MDHFLSIQSIDGKLIHQLLDQAKALKAQRPHHKDLPLKGQTWALLFSKSSTRTRISFEVGIRELGGSPMFLSSADLQIGRGEPIKDTARVMGRLLDGCIIRTQKQSDIESFAHYAQIPTINALSDLEHPCQILADLLTIQEHLGDLEDQKITFVGDGNNNVSRSLAWAAQHLNLHLVIASPNPHQLDKITRDALKSNRIKFTDNLIEATIDSTVIITDTWLSMGEEGQTDKEQVLKPYQVNQALLKQAQPQAIVLHCLPAYRGKEISEETLEAHSQVIFDQAENRLHVQKSVLQWLKN